MTQQSKARHTPGPWYPSTFKDFTAEGTPLRAVFATGDAEKRPADVYGDTQEQTEANARLIAAAPELPHDCADPDCPGGKLYRKQRAERTARRREVKSEN